MGVEQSYISDVYLTPNERVEVRFRSICHNACKYLTNGSLDTHAGSRVTRYTHIHEAKECLDLCASFGPFFT